MYLFVYYVVNVYYFGMNVIIINVKNMLFMYGGQIINICYLYNFKGELEFFYFPVTQIIYQC